MANWKKVKLEEICSVEWGNSELTKASYIPDGEYLAVSAAGCDGRIGHREHAKNTPVISAIGANCGRMFLPREDFTAIKNTITITPVDGVSDGRYLYEVLTFTELPKRGGAQPFMSKGDIESFKIGVPPLAEQRKIAEILRTWDEAIETAEAELKAKQERKRWLMDKLLRLGAAGFSKSSASGWTAQRLGDILEIRHGKNQREVENPEGRYPILGTGGIIGRTNAFLYDRPSVLIGRKGTIDRPQYMDTPFWTIDTLFYTSISDRALPRFIFYVFCTINWQQYNAATGVPSLAASTIESIKIQLPPLAEQREIADILQAVDADMEVINCRIESLRTQKRGLMQKLLTGEVRVAA